MLLWAVRNLPWLGRRPSDDGPRGVPSFDAKLRTILDVGPSLAVTARFERLSAA